MNWKVILAVLGIVAAVGIITITSCGGCGEDPRLRVRPAPPDEDESSAPAPAAPTAQASDGVNRPAPPETPGGTATSPAPLATPLSSSPAPSANSPVGVGVPLGTERGPVGRTPEDRRRAALLRLGRIAQALSDHVAATRRLPPPAIYDDGQAMLSWRVALLPYLGHGELYARFRLNEPWNSPHNNALLSSIPAVYQSPERGDDRTNFLAPVANGTLFGSTVGAQLANIEDGAQNTVMLLEVDDELAVPWTKPEDYAVDYLRPARGWGKLRGDGALVAWADGLVSLVPLAAKPADLAAMYTCDGVDGESFRLLARPAFGPLVSTAAGTPGVVGPSTAPQPGGGVTTPAQPASSPFAPLAGGSSPSGSPGLDTPENVATLLHGALAGNRTWEGLRLAQATLLADASGQASASMRWYPGLSRPALALHWGVGVTQLGNQSTNPSPITWSGKPRTVRAPKMHADLTKYAGEVAERMMESLQARGAEGRYGALLAPYSPAAAAEGPAGRAAPTSPLAAALIGPDHPIKTESIASGITYLGNAPQKDLLRAAKQDGVDVLLVFEVDAKQTRTGQVSHNTTVRVYDAVRGTELASSATLNTLAVNRERTEGNPHLDPVVKGLERVLSYIDQNLQAADLPPGLLPEHAARRLETLLADSNADPLNVLCEARLYYDRRLLSDDQLLRAYQRLAGEVAGSQLFAGAFPQKMEALARWLPRLKPGTNLTRVQLPVDDDE